MTLSLSSNELRTVLRKAAVGAGLPLGLAEDLGEAAVWMASVGLAPVPICLAALEALDRRESGAARYDERARTIVGATGGSLSACHAAGAVVDLLALEADSDQPRAVALEAVDAPVIVLASLAVGGQAQGLTLAAEWRAAGRGHRSAVCAGSDLILVDGDPPDRPADMTVRLIPAHHPDGDATGRRLSPDPARRASVEDMDWRRLQVLAVRTFVPESETSRLSGAGAGVVDRD